MRMMNNFCLRGFFKITAYSACLTLLSCGQEGLTESELNMVKELSKPEGFELGGGVNVAAGDRLTKTVVSVQTFNSQTLELGSCTGTMIAKNWVLTTADCVKNKVNGSTFPANKITVYFNRTNTQNVALNTFGERVAHVFVHRDYNGFNNDIALMQLTKPIGLAEPAFISDVDITSDADSRYFRIPDSPQGVVDLAGFGFSSPNRKDTLNILRKGRTSYLGVQDSFLVAQASPNGTAFNLGGDGGSAWFFPIKENNNKLIIAGVFSRFRSEVKGSLAEPAGKHKDWIRGIVGTTVAQFRTPAALPPPPVVNRPPVVQPPAGPTCNIVRTDAEGNTILQSGGKLEFSVAPSIGAGVKGLRLPDGSVQPADNISIPLISVPANTGSASLVRTYTALVENGLVLVSGGGLKGSCSITLTQLGASQPPSPPVVQPPVVQPPVNRPPEGSSSNCQIQGNIFSLLGSTYYVKSGFIDNSGLNLTTNQHKLLQVEVTGTKLPVRGENTCYCFSGVSPFNPSRPDLNTITKASNVTACP